MNYLHTNDPPKGEVCFWGPSNMQGYFKNPEKTAESRSNDGWIFSGDVGRINPDMSLSIVDRAKNIFKLSQGEYIAPEKLENIFVQSTYVQQCFVYGDSLRDYTIAFFVLDGAAFKWGKEKGLNEQQVCESKEFKQVFYDDLMVLANHNKLNSLEKPKQITLLWDPWTPESGMLTPTMKMKRNIGKERLAADIKRMYNDPIMKENKGGAKATPAEKKN